MIPPITFLYIIPAIFLGGIGSLLLKKGAARFSLDPFQLIKNTQVFLGLALFGMATLLYIPALKLANLSVVYPLSSLSYVVVAILSARFLGERINWFKWSGIILIIVGSFLVTK